MDILQIAQAFQAWEADNFELRLSAYIAKWEGYNNAPIFNSAESEGQENTETTSKDSDSGANEVVQGRVGLQPLEGEPSGLSGMEW